MILFADPVDADVLRIRHEFLDMPGLSLTVPQVARLAGVAIPHAAAMLQTLEREGFLQCTRDVHEGPLYRRAPIVRS